MIRKNFKFFIDEKYKQLKRTRAWNYLDFIEYKNIYMIY